MDCSAGMGACKECLVTSSRYSCCHNLNPKPFVFAILVPGISTNMVSLFCRCLQWIVDYLDLVYSIGLV
jgi:hypothetical protein